MILQSSFFMMIMFVLGIILLVFSSKIDKDIRNSTCMTSDKLVDANKGVFAISIVLIIGAISYGICKYRCDCESVEGFDLFMYVIFSCALGVTIIALGAIMQGEAKKICNSVVGDSQVIWGIGTGITCMSALYLGYQAYEKYKTGDWGGDPGRASRDAEKPGTQAPKIGGYYGSSGNTEQQLKETKTKLDVLQRSAGQSESEIAKLKEKLTKSNEKLMASNEKLINNAEEVKQTGVRHTSGNGDNRNQQTVLRRALGSTIGLKPSSAPGRDREITMEMKPRRSRGGG
jgi:hypothetical protein